MAQQPMHLSQDEFSLIFALDSVPAELRRTVGLLNRILRPSVKVAAVGIQKWTAGNLTATVTSLARDERWLSYRPVKVLLEPNGECLARSRPLGTGPLQGLFKQILPDKESRLWQEVAELTTLDDWMRADASQIDATAICSDAPLQAELDALKPRLAAAGSPVDVWISCLDLFEGSDIEIAFVSSELLASSGPVQDLDLALNDLPDADQVAGRRIRELMREAGLREAPGSGRKIPHFNFGPEEGPAFFTIWLRDYDKAIFSPTEHIVQRWTPEWLEPFLKRIDRTGERPCWENGEIKSREIPLRNVDLNRLAGLLRVKGRSKGRWRKRDDG